MFAPSLEQRIEWTDDVLDLVKLVVHFLFWKLSLFHVLWCGLHVLQASTRWKRAMTMTLACQQPILTVL